MAAQDGSTIDYPNIEQELLEFENAANGTVWRTAHLVLIQSMQSQQLKRVLAIDSPPQLVIRDGVGKKAALGPDGRRSQAGVQVMKIDGNASAEELKQMIMERLKEQGMEVDEAKIIIGETKKK